MLNTTRQLPGLYYLYFMYLLHKICLANCSKVVQSFWDTLYYESQALQDISRDSDTLYIYHFTTKVLRPTAWKCILNGADQGKMTKIAFLIVSIGAYYEIYTTCSTLQKCKTNYVKMMRAKLNSIMRSLERSYPISRSRYKIQNIRSLGVRNCF